MDRMAGVLEVLDVTVALVRDAEMTPPAGLRQFAAGARAALAGDPKPDGPLPTATPEAPTRALAAGTPSAAPAAAADAGDPPGAAPALPPAGADAAVPAAAGPASVDVAPPDLARRRSTSHHPI